MPPAPRRRGAAALPALPALPAAALLAAAAGRGARGEVAWFASWQHASHVRALGPTARELRARGWSVALVIHEEARGYAPADVEVLSAGPLPWTWEEELEFRDIIFAAPSAPSANSTPEEAHAASVRRAEASEAYFLGSQRSLARGLQAALDAGAARPDLLVADVSSPGALDFAELHGIRPAVFSGWPVGATLQAIGDRSALRHPWLPSELFVFTQSAHQQGLYDRLLRAAVTSAVPWVLEFSGFHAPRRRLREELGLPPGGLELMQPPPRAGEPRPLVVVATHWALDRPRPLPPSVVLVGPTEDYAARAAARPALPAGLRQWLADDGAPLVYVSLGTNVQPKGAQISAMAEGMRELWGAARFLWDTRAEMSGALAEVGLPPNVRAEEWVDQLAVLASGRVSAFVTHCGLNSLHEAMHFGVPVVGLPYVADQLVSARLLVEAGVGVRIDTRRVTGQSFAAAVRDVLDAPGYREASRRVGALARSAGGARLAADLLEAASRHGTRHLQMLDEGAAARLWDVYLLLGLPLATIAAGISWWRRSSRTLVERAKAD